jgi:hypothetical protein
MAQTLRKLAYIANYIIVIFKYRFRYIQLVVIGLQREMGAWIMDFFEKNQSV